MREGATARRSAISKPSWTPCPGVGSPMTRPCELPGIVSRSRGTWSPRRRWWTVSFARIRRATRSPEPTCCSDGLRLRACRRVPKTRWPSSKRVLTAAGSSGSPWSFAALTGIAGIASEFMDDRTVAGALLSALHETRAAPASEAERFRARLAACRAPSRGSAKRMRPSPRWRSSGVDLLRAIRDEIRDDPSGEANGDFSPRRLAEDARALATLISRYRSPGGPSWRFTGAIQPPQRLDRPRRVRIAGGRIHVLDRDTDELQTFSRAGEFEGAIGVKTPGIWPTWMPGWGTAVFRFRWWQPKKPWWWAEIS